MKISFIASIRGKKSYNDYYSLIINHLLRQGHKVDHVLSNSEEGLSKLTAPQRIKTFDKFYRCINKSDLVIAECSFPSINAAYEISHALQQGKPVMVFILKEQRDSMLELLDPIFSSDKIQVFEYTEENLVEALNFALKCKQPQINKRFTIILPPFMMAKLDKISKKRKLPKAVYIRQLIEKSLLHES